MHVAIYGCAHYGKSLFWFAGEILFAFFLTEVAGLTPLEMGAVLSASLVLSAGLDVAVGLLARRALAQLDLAAPLQVLGALGSSAALVAVFATPWISPDIRLAWALVAMAAFRIAFTFYDLPQNAMISLLPANARERTRLAAIRIAFSALATLTIAFAMAPLLAAKKGLDSASGFLMFASAPIAIGVATAGFLALALRKRSLHGDTKASSTATGPVERGWLTILALLVALNFFVALTTPLFSKLEPYFAKFTLGSAAMGGVLVAAYAVGTLLAQPIGAIISERWRRTGVILFGAAAHMVGAGVFAVNGPSWIAIFVAGAVLVGLGNGAIGMAIWGAVGDQTRAAAPGREGLVFGALAASTKLALAAGALMLGQFLAVFEYRDQDSATLQWGMAAAPAAAALTAAALALLLRRRGV